MTTEKTVDTSVFSDLTLDHVEMFVADLPSATEFFTKSYGFPVYSAAGSHSVALGTGQIRLILTAPESTEHPATAYIEKHGDGIANIALATSNVAAAFAEAKRRGATPIADPIERHGIVTASILGFGDVVHTFVQRPTCLDPRVLPGFVPQSSTPPFDSGLTAVDHFAVCLEPGTLEATTEFYERTLDLQMIFEERIVVGQQAMISKVVQSQSGTVTLTLIEPDLAQKPGQIDKFLKNHDGAGVQHVAFLTENVVHSVRSLADNGVTFLTTPDAYYERLAGRLEPVRHSTSTLHELNVLVDEDPGGQLFQIFARSEHPRGTLFMEVIERLGANTFGSGNIKALYEAVELEQCGEEA